MSSRKANRGHNPIKLRGDNRRLVLAVQAYAARVEALESGQAPMLGSLKRWRLGCVAASCISVASLILLAVATL